MKVNSNEIPFCIVKCDDYIAVKVNNDGSLYESLLIIKKDQYMLKRIEDAIKKINDCINKINIQKEDIDDIFFDYDENNHMCKGFINYNFTLDEGEISANHEEKIYDKPELVIKFDNSSGMIIFLEELIDILHFYQKLINVDNQKQTNKWYQLYKPNDYNQYKYKDIHGTNDRSKVLIYRLNLIYKDNRVKSARK